MMDVTVRGVLVPVLLATRKAHADARVSQITVDGPNAGAKAVVGGATAPPQLPRIILTLDGEEKHLSAVLKIVVDSGLAKAHGIELVKFSASASKTQQPSDSGPMYKVLKQALRAVPPPFTAAYNALIAEYLKPIEAASRKLFLDFINNLPVLLDKAFTAWNVLRGWEVTGLWPFVPEKILARCTSWVGLPRHAQTSVRRQLEWLTLTVSTSGELLERNLDICLGDTLQQNIASVAKPDPDHFSLPVVKPQRKKKPHDERVIHHRRAIWLNHEAITAERAARAATKAADAEGKAAKAAAKVAKASSATPTIPTTPVTKKRAKSQQAAAPSARKAAKRGGVVKCVVVTCIAVEDPDLEPFQHCSTCAVAFCGDPGCQDALDIHESMCTDDS